jgi:hypothetical protein
MSGEKVIPVFPCHSLKTTLEFYAALGFEILHEQHKPYVYGSVKYQHIQLDFYGSKATQPAQESGHICLVITKELGALHTTFSQGQDLRSSYKAHVKTRGAKVLLHVIIQEVLFKRIDRNAKLLS